MRASFKSYSFIPQFLSLLVVLLVPGLAGQSNSSEKETLETYNLRTTGLPRGWREVRPSLINDDACFAMRSKDANAYLIVIAEIIGVESALTSESFGEIVRENFENAAYKGEYFTGSFTDAIGFEGQSARAMDTINRTRFVYEYWYGVKDGLAVQVIAWSTTNKRREMARAHKNFLSKLELIDPEKRHSSREWMPTIVDFSEEGFTAEFGTDEWLVAIGNDFPSSSVYAEHPKGGFFQAVHLYLDEPEVSAKTALEGFISSIGVDLDDQTVIANKRLKTDWADERRRLEMKVESNDIIFIDTYEIYRVGGHYYILNAWIDQAEIHEDWDVDTAFSMVSFDIENPSLNYDEIPQVRKKGLATFVNHTGLTSLNRGNRADALKLFKRAYELDPEEVVFAGNVAYTYIELGLMEGGKAFTLDALIRHPDDETLNARMAKIDVGLENTEAALNRYTKLYEKGIEDSDIVLDYINLLLKLENYPEAIELAADYAEDKDSRMAKRWHAQVLSEAKKYDEAVEIYTMLADSAGWDSQLYTDVVTTYYYAGQNEVALEWLDKMEDQTGIDTNSLLLRGKNQLELGWYKDARRSFEAALEEKEQNGEAREYLDYVNGLLGKGDATGTNEPLIEVSIPEALTKEIAELEEDGIEPYLDKGLDVVLTRNIRCYNYDTENVFRQTRYIDAHILTREGAEDFGIMEFVFDPTFERLYIHDIEVLDENGNVLSKADRDDFYVLDENDDSMADDDQVLYTPVPGVRAGVTVRYSFTKERRSRPDYFPFTEEYFFSTRPMAYKLVSVNHPEGALSWKTGNGLSEPILSDTELTAWVEAAPKYILDEPFRPDSRDIGPWLAMGSNQASWEDLIEEYLSDIEDRLTPVPEVAAVIEELLSPDDEREDKLRKIIAYVRDTLTYQAIEFGNRGIIPEKCDIILSNHYGDCKDHSVLAYHLLREAGFDPRLILCHTSASVIEELPSLNQFNHMIFALHEDEGWRFFDATDKYISTSIDSPLGLAELFVVPVVRENFEILQIPAYEENSSQIFIDRRLVKDEAGKDYSVSEEATFTGHYASFMRSWLNRRSKAEYTTSLSQLFSDYGQYSFSEVIAHNLDKLEEPLELSINYTNSPSSTTSSLKIVDLPLPWQRYYLRFDGSNERNFPMRVFYPVSIETSLTLALEDGETIEQDDPIYKDISAQTPWLSWSRKAEKVENGIKLKFTSQRADGLFEVDVYDRFKNDFEDVEKAASPTIVISKSSE